MTVTTTLRAALGLAALGLVLNGIGFWFLATRIARVDAHAHVLQEAVCLVQRSTYSLEGIAARVEPGPACDVEQLTYPHGKGGAR